MSVSSSNPASNSRSLGQWLTTLWLFLRSPLNVAAGLLGLALSLSLAALIPQRPATFTTPAEETIWVSVLPEFFRNNYRFFNETNLFQVYDTFWFWIPAGFLVLVCLVNLADYGPALWERFQLGRTSPKFETVPAVHPLITRTERTVRLSAPRSASESAPSDEAFAHLKATLQAEQYQLHESSATTLVAVRSNWAWLGPGLFLAGVLCLMVGLTSQFVFGQSDSVVLSSLSTANNRPSQQNTIGGESLSLQNFIPQQGLGGQMVGGRAEISFNESETEAESRSLSLHRPHFRGGWWLIPRRVQYEARLNLGAERLNLNFVNPNQAISFSYPAENLTFEIRYLPTEQGGDYRLNLLAEAGNPPAEITQTGDRFRIESLNLSGQVQLIERVQVVGYRVPGLIFLLVGASLIAVGLGSVLLAPPSLIWVQATSIGRGSKIETRAEHLRHSLRPALKESTLALPEETLPPSAKAQ
jgi:hypothetical protein